MDKKKPLLAEERLHVWSVGSNKAILSLFLDAVSGQLFVEVARPNATLSKESVQRYKRGMSASTSNGNGTAGAKLPKRSSSVTNLFLKTMRVENPEYFITKHAMPLGRKLPVDSWQYLTWSVAIFPDQIAVVMAVDAAEQFTLQIPFENGLQTTKTSSFSVLCVGETKGIKKTPPWYATTGVMIFRKSIPELQVLGELMSRGPDLTHPGVRFQVKQIAHNSGLIGVCPQDEETIEEIDAGQVIRSTFLLSLSAQNVDLVSVVDTDGTNPVGSVSFGEKLRPKRNHSFATNLVRSGGLDVLLYLFARVVEMKASPTMQALAMRTLLEAAHRNMYLFSDFKRRHSDAISSVLRASACDKGLQMLKIILDVAFDGPVLELVNEGTSYKLAAGRGCRLLYPELIISTINNFDAWVHDDGTEHVIEVIFEVLIWLNVSSVRGGAYSKRKLAQANVLGAILKFCKLHVGGISNRIKVTRTMAERLVELLEIYGPTPPGADFLDELAKLLLLIQEPSCVFVTQDRVNFYYLLAACAPEKGNKSKRARGAAARMTEQRWADGWRILRRSRRPTIDLERSSRNLSQESLWEPKISLWEIGMEMEENSVDGKGNVVKVKKVERKSNSRRRHVDVKDKVLELATVKEGDKVTSQRIESRDLIKMNRAIHNRKVAYRRRTIERRTPLYNRLRAHVRKIENRK